MNYISFEKINFVELLETGLLYGFLISLSVGLLALGINLAIRLIANKD